MRYYQKLIRILKEQKKDTDENSHTENERPKNLSKKLKINLDEIKTEFRESCDLVVREFSFGNGGKIKVALIFLDGMVNLSMINNNIIKPLMFDTRLFKSSELSEITEMEELRERLLTAGAAKTINTFPDAVEACISGDVVLLVDGFNKAIDVGVKGWDKRAVTEPDTETVIRGPREGFTENLRTNTALVRRKIQNPALRIRSFKIGRRTRTQVNILFIDGIANPELIKEAERRLKSIKTDSVLAAGYIEQHIDDAPYSPFQTIWFSEKPDVIAGKLLEGRLAIVVDGTPFVLTVPMLFMENFQTSEDYATRSLYATALRILRLSAFFISMFAPAIYVALTTYHQELIPTSLLFTMAAASEGVPFPAAVEVGIMMFGFEILREAGIRMPRPVGQAISIVGALVMGEAAVQAGLVGAPVVIVVAITAVSSFVIPLVSEAIALVRWFLIFIAATMGSYGITLGALVILIHLASLKSFGSNYLAPLVPFQSTDLKDSVVRVPIWLMRTRPKALKPKDIKRQDFKLSIHHASKQGDDKEEKP